MREHLKRRHYTAFCEATTNDSSDTPSTSKQTRLDSFTRSIVCSRTHSKAITDRITGVIIKDLRPINFVDGEGFQNLMSFVEPGYHLPSATYFTKLIELKYEEAVAKVQQTLQATNYISITSDMWTSLANDAYISLTTHFISGEWNMESVCLGTMPVSERHTGDNISSWIVHKPADNNGHRFVHTYTLMNGRGYHMSTGSNLCKWAWLTKEAGIRYDV